MNDSILDTIKNLLGEKDANENAFDEDIIIFINSAFSVLDQIGISSIKNFKISGSNEVWGDYIKDELNIEFIKQYIYLKVKTVFDPPQNSFVMDAINKQILELESRFNYITDNIK